TPFDETALGEEQEPWRQLLRAGSFPEPSDGRPPGPTLVAPHWRDMLETAPATPLAEYHLGVAQWHAGDRAQAVRSWERGLRGSGPVWPSLRCLAVADQEDRHHQRAADRYAEAFDDLCRRAGETAEDAGDDGSAASVWERLDPGTRARGRFRLTEAGLLLAEGRREQARAVFDEGFEVADLREGDEVIGRLWGALTDEPLPEHYDFRMRPPS